MIYNDLIWNIRFVRTRHSFHRVQMFLRHHKFDLMAIMRPFQETRHIQSYKRRLCITYSNYNINEKIWLFVKENIEVEYQNHNNNWRWNYYFIMDTRWSIPWCIQNVVPMKDYNYGMRSTPLFRIWYILVGRWRF